MWALSTTYGSQTAFLIPSAREIPFDRSGRIQAALTAAWQRSRFRNPEDFVFATSTGRTLAQRTRTTPYRLTGMMLGHSKINMVLRYAHPTQEHQTRAMEKMEQYVIEQKIAFAEQQAPAASHAIQ